MIDTVIADAREFCSDAEALYEAYGTRDPDEVAQQYASTLSPEYQDIANGECYAELTGF